jgi:hypothetical protein
VDLYFLSFRFFQGVNGTLLPRTFNEHSTIALKSSGLELFIMAFRNLGFAVFKTLSVSKLDRIRFITYGCIDYGRIIVREYVGPKP